MATSAQARVGVVIGETYLVNLDGEDRPFLVVRKSPDGVAWGWLFHDPMLDDNCSLLREQGIQAAQRRQPCYCMVKFSALRRTR